MIEYQTKQVAVRCRPEQDLAQGNLISFNDAIQLRNWAVCPKDVLLPLAEIARRILDQEAAAE
jgi:hypothetical protein